jgi:hypothetical protein
MNLHVRPYLPLPVPPPYECTDYPQLLNLWPKDWGVHTALTMSIVAIPERLCLFVNAGTIHYARLFICVSAQCRIKISRFHTGASP